jgi:membrane-bound metal-dependent hydrolase YbcI (DUF457 family)
MFIGHFAVGFAAKKYASRASLAVLLAAPLLPDLLRPLFLLLGWETVRVDPGRMQLARLDFVGYPWSHSLLMCAVWAVLFATIYYWMTRYWPGAVAIVIGVLSHWLLDWITHGADMPLYPSGPKFGLGLWKSVAGTLSVELAMFAIGVWLYVSATRARDRIGRYAFLAYIALLVASYLRDAFSRELPHSVKAGIAWPSLIAGIVMLIWAWWFDRHREPIATDVDVRGLMSRESR